MKRAGSKPWRTARVVLSASYVIGVALLIGHKLETLDWADVCTALQAYRPAIILACASIAASSYLLYSTYDLVARHYVRHELGTLRVMAIAAVSYAFNLNAGSVIGGIGSRVQMYAQSGLGLKQIARIVGTSILSNWLGYLLAGGLLLVCLRAPPAIAYPVDVMALRLLGMAFLLVIALFLAFCRWSRRRELSVRGVSMVVPALPAAMLLLGISCTNWTAISSIIFLLMPAGIPFQAAMMALLSSALAGLVVRVPAGLGVIEMVFLTLFTQTEASAVIAALIAYRLVYYIAPLCIAIAGWLALMAKIRLEGRR